jgi:hypothetical protein
MKQMVEGGVESQKTSAAARWLLDPARVLPVLLAVQAGIWFFFYPYDPQIKYAAARFATPEAAARYLFLSVALIGAAVLGKTICRQAMMKAPGGTRVVRVKLLQRVALVSFVLAVIGELFYVRQVLANPGIFLDAWQRGWFASPGELVGQNRIVGLSSLNNLFTVGTAIYALLAFEPLVSEKTRAGARRVLMVTGLLVILHGLLLTARMFVFYFGLIVFAAFIAQSASNVRRISAVVKIGLLLVAAVWVGETLRAGLAYSRSHGSTLTSWETQSYVGRFLLEAYIGNDFNNTMAILNCDPPRQWVYASNLRTLFERSGVEFVGFKACPDYNSRYGTMNVVAWWWFDFSWIAFVPCLALGGFLGVTYQLMTGVGKPIASGATLLYLIAYPGLASITRINYYALTIYVLPTVFLCVYLMFQRKQPGSAVAPT